MDTNKILNLSMMAGEIMLENGAEIYRIEDTMRIIAGAFGCLVVESFVTPTGIFFSVQDENNQPLTMVKRVKNRTTHLEKVAHVNGLSRTIAEGRISVDEAFDRLVQIKAIPFYSKYLKTLCGGVSCFCFTYMFKGVLMDCVASFFVASLLYYLKTFLEERRISKVIVNIFGGAFVALGALTAVNIGLGINFDKIVIGSIMPLVPGVLLTNAIRDILEGDFLSGTTSGVDAIIVAISIAAGVGITYSTWMSVFGGFIL